MTAKDRAIVVRWKARLTIRKRLLATARTALRVRATPTRLEKVKERNRQVAEAERVIARHSSGAHVSAPVDPILQDSWGWVPGVHDGIDLITDQDDTIVAICDGTVLRAASSGWWGKGARPSNGHPISDGDGVIVLRCTRSVGPFKAGMNFVYGHAEHPAVRKGQKVKAGQRLGRAGFANAWHVHFCVNNRNDDRGVGDRNPRPFVDYSVTHG